MIYEQQVFIDKLIQIIPFACFSLKDVEALKAIQVIIDKIQFKTKSTIIIELNKIVQT